MNSTNCHCQGLENESHERTGADGRAKDIVTIEAKSGLPDNDYIKNSFVNTADTRRVYVFDNQSERLGIGEDLSSCHIGREVDFLAGPD